MTRKAIIPGTFDPTHIRLPLLMALVPRFTAALRTQMGAWRFSKALRELDPEWLARATISYLCGALTYEEGAMVPLKTIAKEVAALVPGVPENPVWRQAFGLTALELLMESTQLVEVINMRNGSFVVRMHPEWAKKLRDRAETVRQR
ncbi:hypothetical protein D9M68_343590 [compost metagenome]